MELRLGVGGGTGGWVAKGLDAVERNAFGDLDSRGVMGGMLTQRGV